ncbi:MAG: helix-turn-helix domain-containing protein [Elusimicrobiota bacterium]|jgi:excisionase family DNA binding protein|nr:helix-turn-helix domain-containing protein [Elusimicrobiota bacterium]
MEICNLKEAAKILEVSAVTVRRWIRSKQLIPCTPYRCKIKFFREDIENFLRKEKEKNKKIYNP